MPGIRLEGVGATTAPEDGLFGRDVECRRLDVLLLHDLRGGRGGALVLMGEPSVGKTALLKRVTTTATEVTVLAARCLLSEASLSSLGLATCCGRCGRISACFRSRSLRRCQRRWPWHSHSDR
jgi:hypothetical protein